MVVRRETFHFHAKVIAIWIMRGFFKVGRSQRFEKTSARKAVSESTEISVVIDD